MNVWIIDDDKDNQRQYLEEFKLRFPQMIVSVFDGLLEARGAKPDFVFIDLSAVEGRTLPCFDNNSYIGNLIHFIERFRSSFIVIMSAIVSHAKEDVDDIRDRCGDDHIFTIDPCVTNALTDFCAPYVDGENGV